MWGNAKVKRRVIMVLSIAVCLFSVQMAAPPRSEGAALPNVKILATGGTIAGAAASNAQMTGYKVGDIGIQTLIDAVPWMKRYANVSGEQVVNISSNNMTDEIWLKIAARVNELAADQHVNGIVITHGTDTLEETAYFLNLVAKTDKPIVLVGAMRPASAISADGPLNLLNAVRLAADPDARARGVLVAMNDQIHSAREVTKTNTTNVDTFKSPELGCLGYMQSGAPVFYRDAARRHTSKTEFDVREAARLPYVEIIYGHVNDNRSLIDAAVAAGAEGIVYAGMGDGSIHQAAEAGLVDAQKAGVAVVRASRCGNGAVSGGSAANYADRDFITGDNLNPQKARILLSLGLMRTKEVKELQAMFDRY